MKSTFLLLITGLLMLFFSCRQATDKAKDTVVAADTLQAGKKHVEKKEATKERDTDSINLELILNSAVKAAEKNKNSDRFEERYIEMMSDSSYQVEVNVSSGFFFTNDKPHLMIRRNTPGTIYIDIFSKSNNKFHKVLSHDEWEMTYVNDTIRDVNGDGLKDFVVNWYGSSGCCLKAFSVVYLLRGDKSFSSGIEFINPTFAPKEKIIRGVCYGHPGDTEMYKYKWNGEKIDTLEYISYQKDDKGMNTGKVIITSNKNKILKIVNTIPKEYRKIDGYDWFTGKGYN